MSQVVLIRAKIGAPVMLAKAIENCNPDEELLAKADIDCDMPAIIRECALKAISDIMPFLGEGAQIKKHIMDEYGNEVKTLENGYRSELGGFEIFRSIITPNLPSGWGIVIEGDNSLRFVAGTVRNYRVIERLKQEQIREEMEKIESFFSSAFMARITEAAMTIMGYKVKIFGMDLIDNAETNRQELSIALQGVQA